MDPILDGRLMNMAEHLQRKALREKERKKELITYDSSLANEPTPYHEKHQVWLKALEKV